MEVNRDKSRITTAKEGFDFLGFHFTRTWDATRKMDITYTYPSDRSVKRFRGKAKEVVPRRYAFTKSMNEEVKQINHLISGWYNYYRHTNAAQIFRRLQAFVQWKLAKYYCWIHKIRRVSGLPGIYNMLRD